MDKDDIAAMMARNKANTINKLKESAPFVAFLVILTTYACGLMLVITLLTYFTHVIQMR